MAKTIQLKVKGYIDNLLKVYETHREDAVILETETTHIDDKYILRCEKIIDERRAYCESVITKALIIYTDPKVFESVIDSTFDYGFKNLEK